MSLSLSLLGLTNHKATAVTTAIKLEAGFTNIHILEGEV